MTDAIVHRGPDDDGHYLAPGIALGMRRLSVIDVESSRQPIANERGDVHTVLNGEIFNYRALASDCEARPQLSHRGDTETIVHLYEEHGPRFREHLKGMFAVAVWDEPDGRLTLARDRMGVKPLYYAGRRGSRVRLGGQGAARRRSGRARARSCGRRAVPCLRLRAGAADALAGV